MTHIGPALKRLRVLRSMKQSHVAELAGVTQATVSRWERGTHAPDPEQAERLVALLAVRLDGAAERALRRLVESSALPTHLVCDVTHRLLAASPARGGEWLHPPEHFLGRPIWRYASDFIRQAEARLPDVGWYEPDARPVVLWTGANDSPEMRILPRTMMWERLILADGRAARLCTNVADDMADAPDVVTVSRRPL